MSELPDPYAGLAPEQKRALLAELLKKKARQKKTIFPASDGQRAMWYIHQTVPESTAYHVALSIRIRSNVNIDAFRLALQAVVNRHATLRTTYALQENNLVQEIYDYQDVAFQQIDASSWDEDELYRQVLMAYRQVFNLETGPVARWCMFCHAPQDYVFLITVHHIAIDAWSLWIILEDLRQALQAQIDEQSIHLPPPPAYTSWVKWQMDTLASPEGKEHQAFWLQQLAGDLPVLNLPLDFPRPAIQTYQGDSHSFQLSPEQTRQIKAYAQAEGVTLYMLLLAVYQVLLSRYTGQEDILIGTPTAGRNQPEFLGTVGYFVNPVTLRADLSGAPNFKAYLSQVKEIVLNALSHQDYPFIRVVENLHLRQDPSRSPVFQCLFNLHNVQRAKEVSALLTQSSAGTTKEFCGLLVEPYFFPQEEGQFELSLEVIDTGETLLCTLRYHKDLFRLETAERLRRSFQMILAAILENPSASLAKLPIITAEERRQILEEWNQSQRDYPNHLRAHQLFEAQVTRTPDSVAAIFDDQSLTYDQLNCRANQLAHHLRLVGVAPDQLVGIYLDRSLNMLVAVLGVLKSGAAYVPMDPIYPPQRIQSMMDDSQMLVIITQQSLLDSLPQHSTRCVLMDESRTILAGLKKTNPNPVGTSDSLAYVIFTSGSTGRPKGIQIPHHALVNFLLSMQEQPAIQPSDVLVSVTTLSFDIAGLELYLPLISGARVVILNADISADGIALADALDHYQATILQATPATWRLLVETGWPGRPSLKMLCGGEPLHLSLAQQLLQKGGELWNMYGPTETTIWSTLRQITSQDVFISIGRPIANTQAYILDHHLQPVPAGVIGSLYLGGDGLARGYLNRPELTAEKFIPHPFRPAGRIYHTGDLARYLPDGNIECLGREDSQVKIRGFRIELGEIEAVLRLFPAILHAVVLAREDVPGEKRLVAYYTSDASPTSRELSRFLREKLPIYMVPSAYVPLETLPLTPNGKVDRRALPPPSQTRTETQASSNPPTTISELFIAGIWQELLQVNQINVFDNFFDLGGHSLLAMQVVAQIQEKCGIRIEPTYLRIESLGQLALRLDQNTL